MNITKMNNIQGVSYVIVLEVFHQLWIDDIFVNFVKINKFLLI